MAVDIQPALTSLLTRAEAALTTSVGRSFIQVGADVAWDDCCNGQLWARVLNVVPVYPPNSNYCEPWYWRATFALGIVRCITPMGDQAQAPAASAITADALKMTTDMTELLNSLTCDPDASVFNYGIDVDTWSPLGPTGGCAGGEWTLVARINNCACPPAP